MSWKQPLAWALGILTIAGCGSERTVIAAAPPEPPSAQAVDSSSVLRMQKGENEPSASAIRTTGFQAGTEPFPVLAEGKVAVRIRAQVNGVAILDDEVREACLPFLQKAGSPAEQKQILERTLQDLIDREIVMQDLLNRMGPLRPQYLDKLKEAAHKEFEKQVRAMMTQVRKAGVNIQTEDELAKILRDQGQSLEVMRRQVERRFMTMEYMRSRIYPMIDRIGHEQLVEYYQQHSNEFQVPDSVKWQDIFIDSGKFHSREEASRLAEQVAARARAGEDFNQLLRTYDNGDSSLRNGEGYGQRHGEIKPLEVEPVLFKLKDGEIGPVVAMATGYHIVHLVKREYAGLRPLDDKTQAEIRRKLQNDVAEREYKRMVAELKRKATIEIAGD